MTARDLVKFLVNGDLDSEICIQHGSMITELRPIDIGISRTGEEKPKILIQA